MIIKARNTLPDESLKTYLTNAEVAGTNMLRWRNPNGFTASWGMQIGKTGEQLSEIVLLGTATPATNSVSLTANTLYAHSADTPLYAIKYDQMVFEVSTVGSVGTAVPITGGTITIQPNSPYTVFDHTAGSISYAYKTYFKNSILNLTSLESDWLIGTPSNFSLARIRQRVKDRLYDASYIPNDSMIDDWINEWVTRMQTEMVDVNEDYGLGTTSVAFGNNVELGTITNFDFRGRIKRVWAMTSTGTFQATKMDSSSFIPSKTFVDSYPYYYMQGDSVIGRKPSDTAGTLLIEYDAAAPFLTNDDDTIPVPMQSFTGGIVEHALANALRKDNKYDLAELMAQKSDDSLAHFKKWIAPRLRSGATYIDIVEDTGSTDDVWL